MVDQTIARHSPRSVQDGAPAWYRPKTRKIILDAARKLIENEGLEDATLGRVAHITGFAPAIVYAYFVKKSDFVTAIVADDIASYARTIIDFPFTKTECSPSYDGEIEDWASLPALRQEGRRDAELAPLAGSGEWDRVAGAPQAAMSRVENVKFDLRTAFAAPVETPNDIASRPESDGSAADLNVLQFSSPMTLQTDSRFLHIEPQLADGSLERRISQFEQALAALEMRVSQLISDHAGSLEEDASRDATTAFVQDEVRLVESRLEGIRSRIDGTEKQLSADLETQTRTVTEKLEAQDEARRQDWSEFRTLLHDISERLEVLERSRNAIADGIEAPASAESSPKPTADESYSAAARQAVHAAVSLTRSDKRKPLPGIRFAGARLGMEPTSVLLAMFVGLGLMVLSAGLFLKDRSHALQSDVFAAAPAPIEYGRGPVNEAAARIGRARSAEGLAFLNGEGVQKSPIQAARLLSAAAASGEPVAEYWLATLYEHGNGVTTNKQEANRLYFASATQGNLRAMYKLAVSYAEGWGTQQNYTEAARWFSYAAEHGFVNAQYNLGVLYERGLGVPQSLLDAYKWYALAAAQGDKVSAERVDVLSSQLGADDLAVARQAVSDFKPQERNPAANWTPGSSATLSKTQPVSPKA